MTLSQQKNKIKMVGRCHPSFSSLPDQNPNKKKKRKKHISSILYNRTPHSIYLYTSFTVIFNNLNNVIVLLHIYYVVATLLFFSVCFVCVFRSSFDGKSKKRTPITDGHTQNGYCSTLKRERREWYRMRW